MRRLKLIFWNPEQSRIRTAWRILIQLIVFLLLQVIFYILFRFITDIPLAPKAEPLPLQFYISAVVSLLSALISIWIAARFLDRRFFSNLGFRLNKDWWINFAFGMGLGVILMSLIFLIELAAGWVQIGETFHTGVHAETFLITFLIYFLVFTAVAVYEEIMFRGYLIKNLSEGLNFKKFKPSSAVIVSLIITSLLFGIGHIANPHATWISSLNISLAGLLLGFSYVLTGELAIPIGLHLTWNFFEGNVYGFPVSGTQDASATVSIISHQQSGPVLWTGGEFGPEAGLLASLMMLFCILLVFIWVRFRRKSVSIRSDIAAYTAPQQPDRGLEV